jgi:hypothetical protein
MSLPSRAIRRDLIRFVVRVKGEHVDHVLSFIDSKHCTVSDAVVVAKIRGARIFEQALLFPVLLRVGFERLDDRADRRPK